MSLIDTDRIDRGGRVMKGSNNQTGSPEATGQEGREETPHIEALTYGTCSSCGTCIEHDSCADAENPLVPARGDCVVCGACGECIRECRIERDEEALAEVSLP